MKRIGLLGIDDQTETLLAAFFGLDPDTQVFLSGEYRQRANPLAMKFPCWIQDDEQSVIDEADIILVHSESHRLNKDQDIIKYRQSQLVIFLDSWPSFNSQIRSPLTDDKISFVNRHIALQNVSPFSHLTVEQIDDYLFIVRALLMSMKSTYTLEINFQTSSEHGSEVK